MSSTASAVTGVRGGFRTITPFLIHDKAAELVDFMKSTFGAEELKRNTGGDAHGFYSEVRIGDSVIMIAGGTAAQGQPAGGASRVRGRLRCRVSARPRSRSGHADGRHGEPAIAG
jgi:hypothetical protein